MATKLTKTTFTASTPTLSMTAVIDLICSVGDEVTILVQGDMGSGKTSLLTEVAKRKRMRGVYFDCTTKDIGDLFLPDISRSMSGEAQCVSFIPNEEFGVHHNQPIVLMLDELGKNRGILNGLLRVMQERHIGSRPLPKGSIVFATTNLGAENVGDMLPPHARNRIMVIRMLKPNFEEWMVWSSLNDIEPALIGAAHENQEFFQSFTDYENPDENMYIYDPRVPSRTSFVTPRSLAKCSPVLRNRAVLGEHTTKEAMAGLIGGAAAAQIMIVVTLDDQLPTYEDIARRQKDVKIPDSAAAKIMTAIKCLQRVERNDYDEVHDYILRMPMEIQGVFFNQVMKHPKKKEWVPETEKFTQFIRKNFGMFTSN